MQVQQEAKPYDTINVTPMLDLAYVLLVVFILMTTAAVQGITIAMPKPSAAPPTEQHPIHVLKVRADGGLAIDGAPRSPEQARQDLEALRAADAKTTVIVQGEADAPYAHVIAAIDLCNLAGVSMSLATARIGF